VGLVVIVAGGWLLAGSAWSGPLDARGLKLAAAAMAAVAGVRMFGRGRARTASLAIGALAGVALVAWGGVA
jgi:xanthine/uracil permease